MLGLEGRYSARGLRVISVTVDGEDEDERKHVAETAREEKMTYPCFLDVDGTWSKAADMTSIPVFVVLGRDGRMIYKHSGKLGEGSEALEKMRAVIERALEKAS